MASTSLNQQVSNTLSQQTSTSISTQDSSSLSQQVLNTGDEATSVNIDPVEIKLSSSYDTLSIGQNFELKIEVLFSPKPFTSYPDGWQNYSLKIQTPAGFETTGGSYTDYTEGSFNSHGTNAPKVYTLTGFFKPGTDSTACFKALRSTAGASSSSTFWQRAEKCITIKSDLPVEPTFDAFAENKALMDRTFGSISDAKSSQRSSLDGSMSISIPVGKTEYFSPCDMITVNVNWLSTILNYSVEYLRGNNYIEIEQRYLTKRNGSFDIHKEFLAQRGNFRIRIKNSLGIGSNTIYFISKTIPNVSISPSTPVAPQRISLSFSSQQNQISDLHNVKFILVESGNELPSEVKFKNLFTEDQIQIVNNNPITNSISTFYKVDECDVTLNGINQNITLTYPYISAPRNTATSTNPLVLTAYACTNVTEWRNNGGTSLGTGDKLNITQGGSYFYVCGSGDDAINSKVFTVTNAPILASTATILCRTSSTTSTTTLTLTNCTGTPTWKKDNVVLGFSGTSYTGTAGGYQVSCGNGSSDLIHIQEINVQAGGSSTDHGYVVMNGCEPDHIQWYKQNGANWDLLTPNNSDRRQYTLSAGMAGTYAGKCTNMCSDFLPTNGFTFTEAPTVSPYISATNHSLCMGESSTLSLYNCSTNLTWQKNGTNYLGGTQNNANAIKTLSTSEIGQYRAMCGSMLTNTVDIVSSILPAAPIIQTNKISIVPYEAFILSANVSGNVEWRNAQNQLIGTGSSYTTDVTGCYYATYTNSCGTSSASNTICIGFSPLRIDADAAELFANQTTTLTLQGCNGGYAVWKKNGVYVNQSTNPLIGGPGSYEATCEYRTGQQLPYTSRTIATKASEAIYATADRKTAFMNDHAVLTATGCSNGLIVWEVRGEMKWTNPTTTMGYGTFKAGCWYADNQPILWSSVTITAKQPETVTITANKTAVNPTEQVLLTGTGCNANYVKWEIKGQRISGYIQQVTGPGTYLARCQYSDTQMGPWVPITIAPAAAGALTLVPDKTAAKIEEPLSIQSSGCTYGTVLWTLPQTDSSGRNLTYVGDILYANGPGLYKATCVRKVGAVSSPEASVTIASRPLSAPEFTASKSSALPNEYIELIGIGCPDDGVQWGIPRKDAAGNIYYTHESFRTLYAKGPGIYKARCKSGDFQNWVDLRVFETSYNGISVITTKTSARPDETVGYFAYGCNLGQVQWKFGTETLSGHNINHIGPAQTMVRCLNDPTTSPDWVRVHVKLSGNLMPILSSTKATACPDDPVTVSVSGCPAGWGWDIRYINPGQEAYYEANRTFVEKIGTTYYTVFTSVSKSTVTLNGPRRYWARCKNQDGSYKTNFNEAFIDIDPAVPADFKIAANAPLFEGNTLQMAATQSFNAAATYQWQRLIGTTYTNIAGATQRIYTKANIASTDAGTYRCILSVGAGCTASADMAVVVTDCNFSVNGINPASGELQNFLIKSKNIKNNDALILKAENVSQGTITWTGPGHDGISDESIIVNKAGLYKATYTPYSSSKGCSSEFLVVEPEPLLMFNNKEREGKFVSGLSYKYIPIHSQSINIKYYKGNVEVPISKLNLGKIKYNINGNEKNEFLYTFSTANTPNFSGIVIKTDFQTNQVIEAFQYTNGIPTNKLNFTNSINQRNINEVCKIVYTQCWDTDVTKGNLRSKFLNCIDPWNCINDKNVTWTEKVTRCQEWVQYVACDVYDGTIGDPPMSASGGGGGSILLTPASSVFKDAMCKNVSYLIDSKVMDHMINNKFGSPCAYEKKYKLLLRLIHAGLKKELNIVDMKDGIFDNYISNMIKNDFQYILHPSRVMRPDSSFFWNTSSIGCSITDKYTNMTFKTSSERELLEDAMLTLSPKITQAYFALVKFITDCGCPTTTAKIASVPCCRDDILEEVVNNIEFENLEFFGRFDSNTNGSCMSNADITRLWDRLSNGKMVSSTNNPNNPAEVSTTILGTPVVYSPNNANTNAFINFLNCGDNTVSFTNGINQLKTKVSNLLAKKSYKLSDVATKYQFNNYLPKEVLAGMWAELSTKTLPKAESNGTFTANLDDIQYIYKASTTNANDGFLKVITDCSEIEYYEYEKHFEETIWPNSIREVLENSYDFSQQKPDCDKTNRTGNINFNGTAQHWLIQWDYLAKNPGGRREFRIPGASSTPGSTRPGYCDLANVDTGELYEIKPSLQVTAGETEVINYLSFANINCPNIPNWRLGINYPFTIFPWKPNKELVARHFSSGVIEYFERNLIGSPLPLPILLPDVQALKLKRLLLDLKNDPKNFELNFRLFCQLNPDEKLKLQGLGYLGLAAYVIYTFVNDASYLGIGDDLPNMQLAWRLHLILKSI